MIVEQVFVINSLPILIDNTKTLHCITYKYRSGLFTAVLNQPLDRGDMDYRDLKDLMDLTIYENKLACYGAQR